MEQTRYDVFISYSRKDYVDGHKNVIPGNEVSKIKEILTSAGISFWFDEDGVYSGNEFAKVIVRSIKASKVFVFLSTNNSNQSEWTANEISTAYMLKKKIIPVRIDDSVYHDDVILYLSRLSHIDYMDNPEKGRMELVRSINSYLEEEKVAEEQKKTEELLRQKELERQRRQQEEEKKRQEQMARIESEIAALESQKTEREKIVLQKEQELKYAQVDLKACEAKIQKLQNKIKELREPNKKEEVEVKQLAEEKKKAEEEEEENKSGEKRHDDEAYAAFKIITVGGVSFKMIRVDGNGKHYYIGETQVTQELWKAVMDSNLSGFIGKNRPVVCVSWNDCQQFMRKLNAITKKEFRLPTVDEWEYAAKGGNKMHGYEYAGSNDIDEVAWYDENIRGNCYGPHDVKTKKPNELGIYDMSGNVWEWCQDYYGTYSSSAQTNPTGPYSGSNRVLRGGCWGKFAKNFRVSYRKNLSSDFRNFNLGLRLVL